ncbi:helix-turn-helix domain-containing protein [Streptomyces sp. NPDC047928]|uniref:helix-turn-helix domain-containing protein n=1 Tax=unclassified Streptomyces TaxID=2593676 RepID=UPI00371B47AE
MTHVRHRHREKFTVVGNHLAQHQGLSACAIGIGVYIQSLPDGALVGIKVLTARFPEGETRIAGALRELEAAGYLERTVERVGGARIVTRTTWHERPGHPAEPPKPVRPTPPTPRRAPEPVAELTEELRPAATLLAGLRQHEPRLTLSEQDVRRLAPHVREWLARGIDPAAVTRTLSGGLPGGTIRWPGRFLEHRLTAWLPPHLPEPAPAPAPDAPARPAPMQNCDGCDRGFRAPTPGKCRDCRETRRSEA